MALTTATPTAIPDVLIFEPQVFRDEPGFLHFADVAEGERAFNALAERGMVQMPFQPTFWAKGFGMLIDQFDSPWIVNSDQMLGT